MGKFPNKCLLGHATNVELDAVLLPAPLRDYAGLDKQMVLTGQINKLELWDADTWNTARATDMVAGGARR